MKVHACSPRHPRMFIREFPGSPGLGVGADSGGTPPSKCVEGKGQIN